MDASAAIVVSVPILLPIVTQVGVDPVHFGMVTVFSLMIGLLTPPIGVSLYMLADVAHAPLPKVIKSVVPYYPPLLITLALIVFFPQITTIFNAL